MISKRLKMISSMLPKVKTLADVGCDHGYLIIDAFINKKIEYAYAIDNKKMPLEKAILNISKNGLENQVSFLLSDGLTELKETVDVVTIAGMGGLLIIEILEKGFTKLNDAIILVQANRNVYDVRKFLSERFYKITDEKIIFEDKKYYEIVKFEKTEQLFLYNEDELSYGPILIKTNEPLFKEKLANDLRILHQINFQTEEITQKINKIEELLSC